MMTGCALILGWYDWMDDRYDYSDELFKCLGDTYISVMTPQGDTGLCAHSNTLSHYVACRNLFAMMCIFWRYLDPIIL